MTKYPLVIPSKGRAGRTTTTKTLQAARLPFFVLVEPDEHVAYVEALSGYDCATVLVLPENNRGLGYSRAWSSAHFRDQGIHKIWQVDDDLTSFVAMQDKPTGIPPLQFFTEIEREVDRHTHVATAGGVYVQAMRDPNAAPHRWNRHLGTCFLNDVHTPVPFDPTFVVRQDLHFNLSNIIAGWRTLKFQRLGFRCATLGKNEGGCKPWYEDKSSVRMAERIVKRWPGICALADKDTPDQRIEVDWRKLDRDAVKRRLYA